MTWKDVDFDAKVLTVRDTKNGTDHSLPLNALLLRIPPESKTSSFWQFCISRTEKPRLSDLSVKSVAELVSKSGVAFAPHDLRRTFVLLTEESGIDVVVRKRLLNHSSQDVTEKHYAVRNPERLRPAMNAIDQKVRELIGPLADLFGEDVDPSDHRLLALSPISRALVPSQSYPSTNSELRSEPVNSLGQLFIGAQQILIEAKIIQVLIKSGSGTKKDFYSKIGAGFAVHKNEMERILGEMIERRIIWRYRQEGHWRYEIAEVV